MPLPAARALATAMMGGEPEPGVEPDAELTELELSAAGEAANQMMAAAAAAMSAVLGQEVEIASPETRVIATRAEALAQPDPATSVVSVAIDLLGHQCRLVQLVPHAFVVRMTRALDNLDAELPTPDEDAAVQVESDQLAALPTDVLDSVGLRVSMTIRRAVSLAPGAIVELDRELEDPIDLYVNGRQFATGRLVTLDDGEWAVTIDTVAFGAASLKGE
jgi:flagellar motor switch protein FliN/FliY